MPNTDQLENILAGYVGEITEPLTAALAQVALDNYIAAANAFANINASAASSYSDARGTISKRDIDAARENRDRLWDEFVELVDRGGVSIPITNDSVSYWDLSGFGG